MLGRKIVTCQRLAPARALVQFFVRRAAGVSNCSGCSSSRRPRRGRGAQRRSNPWPKASRGAARSHAQDAPWRPSMASGVDRSERPGSPLACAKDRHPKGGDAAWRLRRRSRAAIEPGPEGTRRRLGDPWLWRNAKAWYEGTRGCMFHPCIA